MHGHIGDKKENTFVTIFFYPFEYNTSFNLVMQVLHLTEHGFYKLHTGIQDWRVTMVRWLFMPFS